MARGGYFVGVNAQAVDDFAAALKAAGGKPADLRAVHRKIADLGERSVERHVPVGHGSAKDSKGHAPPGHLRSTVKGGSSQYRAWVQVGDERTPYIFVQEWGGSSYWHRAGVGALRALNKAHRGIGSLGDGDIGWSHTYSMRGRRAARGMTTSVRTKGHIVYKKARKPRGYFIWNVAYHLRQQIGEEYCRGMKQLAEEHGIIMDIAISPALDIKSTNGGTN